MTNQLKMPPHNLEAEQSVLGCILIDTEGITKIGNIVTPDDFYQESHRLIYGAMLDLYEKRIPIDLLSLSNRLQELGQLDIVGGQTYLSSLANFVPTASHIVNYAEIVQKKVVKNHTP
ncbi:MAG: hypothetical protein NTV81_02460 [Candidatus Komeilibacteria bacterium]|nr:hypothetical protein [Candidatus Komeilibacteria bacterium]